MMTTNEKPPLPTIMYHVFSNEIDEYTESEVLANATFDEWVEEYGCARLFEEHYEEDGDEMIDEFCIRSEGSYPQ